MIVGGGSAWVRVAAFEPRSLANGPGVRAVLWVQGCGRGCPGCCNAAFQPREGGRDVGVGEVARWMAAAEGIEGVTFSGGEPFDQAAALTEVARAAQGMGLGVMVFTGYPWEELRGAWGGSAVEVRGGGADAEGRAETGRGTDDTEVVPPGESAWGAMLGVADLLVAGPYEQARPGEHPLLASANQELVFLTGRYRGHGFGRRRRVEFRIGRDGVVRASGLAQVSDVEGTPGTARTAGTTRRT